MKDGAPLAIAADAATFFLASAVPLFLFYSIAEAPRPRVGRRQQKEEHLGRRGRGRALYMASQADAVAFGTFTAINFVRSVRLLQPLLIKFNLQPDWTARGFHLMVLLGTNRGPSLLWDHLISTGGVKKRRILRGGDFDHASVAWSIGFGLSKAALYGARHGLHRE